MTPVGAQHPGGGQIRFHNHSMTVQRQIANRRKIIQRTIPVSRRFELLLRPAQLLILHLQFDLIDLQLVHQPLDILHGHVANFLTGTPQKRLGSLAQHVGLLDIIFSCMAWLYLLVFHHVPCGK